MPKAGAQSSNLHQDSGKALVPVCYTLQQLHNCTGQIAIVYAFVSITPGFSCEQMIQKTHTTPSKHPDSKLGAVSFASFACSKMEAPTNTMAAPTSSAGLSLSFTGLQLSKHIKTVETSLFIYNFLETLTKKNWTKTQFGKVLSQSAWQQ